MLGNYLDQVMPFVTKVKESVAAQGPKAMNVTLDFDEKALFEEVSPMNLLTRSLTGNYSVTPASLLLDSLRQGREESRS